MPLNPSPKRQKIRVFPTPLIEDVIFTVTIDATGAKKHPPILGTPHPETATFPNHELVHVSTSDDEGLKHHFTYAATRDYQERYAYSIEYPYGGNKSFPRITRQIVLPRSDTADGNKLDLGTADPYIDDAVLVAQTERRIEGELDGLFVGVMRIYDVIPGEDNGNGLEQIDNGYKLERPLGISTYVRLTWKLSLPREVADDMPQTDLSQCPVLGFTNLKLVGRPVIQAAEDNNQVSTITRTYEGNLSGDAFPSPAVTGPAKEYPGALAPEKFCLTVTKTVDTRRISSPGADPVTDTAPSGTLEAVQVKPESTLIGTKEIIYGAATPGSLAGKQWDNNLHAPVPYTVEVATPAAAAAIALVAGTELTIQPLNRYWSIVTKETPTPSSIGSTAKRWFTTHAFTWPQVLTSLRYGIVPVRPSPGEEASLDGGELYVDWTMKPQWSGLCTAEIEVGFSLGVPIPAAIASMQPTSLEIRWPGVASFSIPACLHPGATGGGTFVGSTGTEHPRYGYVIYPPKEWPATNYTDWPASLVIDYSVQPYKNGYRIQKVTVFKPY